AAPPSWSTLPRSIGCGEAPPASTTDAMSVCTPDKSAIATPANLVLRAAELLFINGQTTETLVQATRRLPKALGFSAVVFPRWGELAVEFESAGGRQLLIAEATPLGVDMGKVAAVMAVIDGIRS